MLISSHLNSFYPLRQWDPANVVARETQQQPGETPVVGKTSQEPLTQRPVVEPEKIERYTNKNKARSSLMAEERSAETRRALDAYHEVGTNQERAYVHAVFGVDVYV